MTNPRKRDAYVSFWCPPEMRDEIEAKATGCGMKRSEYIRSCMAATLDGETNVPPSGDHCKFPREDA